MSVWPAESELELPEELEAVELLDLQAARKAPIKMMKTRALIRGVIRFFICLSSSKNKYELFYLMKTIFLVS